MFKQLGYINIQSVLGDGTVFSPKESLFDAIVVTAGAPAVPEVLTSLLTENGRLIIPVGDEFKQNLLSISKDSKGKFSKEIIEYVRFVPLIGENGWKKR